jgi:hypothetical protein
VRVWHIQRGLESWFSLDLPTYSHKLDTADISADSRACGDGCTLFVPEVVLRTLIAKPIALNRASEAYAVRVNG